MHEELTKLTLLMEAAPSNFIDIVTYVKLVSNFVFQSCHPMQWLYRSIVVSELMKRQLYYPYAAL